MSPFWSTMLGELHGRGRTGMLFLGVVFLLVSLALLAAALSVDLLHGWVLPFIVVLGGFLLAMIVRAFWLACTRKHGPGAVGELSSDELNKARLKLGGHRTTKS